MVIKTKIAFKITLETGLNAAFIKCRTDTYIKYNILVWVM